MRFCDPFRAQGHIVTTITPKDKGVIDDTAMLFNILQKKKYTLKFRLRVVGKCPPPTHTHTHIFCSTVSVGSTAPISGTPPPPYSCPFV